MLDRSDDDPNKVLIGLLIDPNKSYLPTAGLPQAKRNIDGLVEILIDATTKFSEPLTEKRIFSWHAALFPTGYSGLHKIVVGHWRNHSDPMRVVSGSDKKQKVHFEAIPTECVRPEMKQFLSWWNEKVIIKFSKSAREEA